MQRAGCEAGSGARASDPGAGPGAKDKDQMHLMANVLMERETVDGDECQALLDNKWDEWLEHEKTGAVEAAANTIAEKPVAPVAAESPVAPAAEPEMPTEPIEPIKPQDE